MKYREEFEDYQKGLMPSKRAIYRPDSKTGLSYDSPIVDTLYRTFAAGYEAALNNAGALAEAVNHIDEFVERHGYGFYIDALSPKQEGTQKDYPLKNVSYQAASGGYAVSGATLCETIMLLSADIKKGQDDGIV